MANLRPIAEVTTISLASFGVSEIDMQSYLQISVLIASLIFSMFKLWIEYKKSKKNE